MTDLNKRAFRGLAQFIIVMAVILFVGAGTINYWQAWMALAVWFFATLAITLYLTKNDPALLARRMKVGAGAEKEAKQKIIQAIASVAFIAAVALPSLDHRFGWSEVATSWVIIGDALMLLGFLIVFLVFRVNSYTSGVVEIGEGQKVVSTGPYALVRHPMYSGAILLFVGIGPGLGSWWGLLAAPVLSFVMVWRLLDEEKFLITNLPGYADYRTKVRYRLAPLVW